MPSFWSLILELNELSWLSEKYVSQHAGR